MVRYGRRVPSGFLPVFSVGTTAEAKNLLVLACQTNIRGEFLARELVLKQTLENLNAFSVRLAKAHDLMAEKGRCSCKAVKA